MKTGVDVNQGDVVQVPYEIPVIVSYTRVNFVFLEVVCLLYEIKRELKRIHIDGCRCDERLNSKTK